MEVSNGEREGGREVLLSDLATEVYVTLWKLGFSSLTLSGYYIHQTPPPPFLLGVLLKVWE